MKNAPIGGLTNRHYVINQNVNLTVDFSGGRFVAPNPIGVTLRSDVGGVQTMMMNIRSSSIVGNRWQITADMSGGTNDEADEFDTAAGEINGGFYGPRTEEIAGGGQFVVPTGTTMDNIVKLGVFARKQ